MKVNSLFWLKANIILFRIIQIVILAFAIGIVIDSIGLVATPILDRPVAIILFLFFLIVCLTFRLFIREDKQKMKKINGL